MIQPLRDDLMVQQQLPAQDEFRRRWQHMVAVIMLNQTGRKPVKTVFPVFVDRWDNPYAFYWFTNLSDTEQAVKDVIWPFGHDECAIPSPETDDCGLLDLGPQRCYNAVWHWQIWVGQL